MEQRVGLLLVRAAQGPVAPPGPVGAEGLAPGPAAAEAVLELLEQLLVRRRGLGLLCLFGLLGDGGAGQAQARGSEGDGAVGVQSQVVGDGPARLLLVVGDALPDLGGVPARLALAEVVARQRVAHGDGGGREGDEGARDGDAGGRRERVVVSVFAASEGGCGGGKLARRGEHLGEPRRLPSDDVVAVLLGSASSRSSPAPLGPAGLAEPRPLGHPLERDRDDAVGVPRGVAAVAEQGALGVGAVPAEGARALEGHEGGVDVVEGRGEGEDVGRGRGRRRRGRARRSLFGVVAVFFRSPLLFFFFSLILLILLFRRRRLRRQRPQRPALDSFRVLPLPFPQEALHGPVDRLLVQVRGRGVD